ncbi:hypothetical protein LIA77_01581 [Sarocladium implicatum]|nr:hypothetical protein LIA77_01581 [Sarocladium implicatum]
MTVHNSLFSATRRLGEDQDNCGHGRRASSTALGGCGLIWLSPCDIAAPNVEGHKSAPRTRVYTARTVVGDINAAVGIPRATLSSEHWNRFSRHEFVPVHRPRLLIELLRRDTNLHRILSSSSLARSNHPPSFGLTLTARRADHERLMAGGYCNRVALRTLGARANSEGSLARLSLTQKSVLPRSQSTWNKCYSSSPHACMCSQFRPGRPLACCQEKRTST